MSSSTSSKSGRQTFQSYTRSNSRTNASINLNMSSKQTFASISNKTTQLKQTTKLTSGKVNYAQNDDDFEDVNEFPLNRKVFYFTLIFPCIGFYGIMNIGSSNRREKLWAVAMIIYAVLMTIVMVIVIALFVALY